MPRDLDGQERPTTSTKGSSEADRTDDQADDAGKFVIVGQDHGESDEAGEARTLRSLHPYTRPLTVSDLESCVALENAAFDVKEERCSPEKVSPLSNVT